MKRAYRLITGPMLFLLLTGPVSGDPRNDEPVDQGMALLNSGLTAKNRGDHEGAMRLLLECYDRAEEFGRSFQDIKVSFLMVYLEQLSRDYPPVKTELLKRQQIIFAFLERGSFTEHAINALTEITEILNNEKILLAHYKKFVSNLESGLKTLLVRELFDLLYTYGLFDDIYKNLDVVAEARKVAESFLEASPSLRLAARESVVSQIMRYRHVVAEMSEAETERLDVIIDRVRQDGEMDRP